MARRFTRDARGRFASKGVGGIGAYQGQTGGRGARLKTPGNTRAGGGTISRVTQQGERKGIVSLGKKRKGLSEGQSYASTQAKAKAARQADTTKRLEAFNKKTQARLDTQTKPPVSSVRQAAADRIKVKTETKRKLKTDRASVIPANPKAQRITAQRPKGTVAKPRTKGNTKGQVTSRVNRKAAATNARLQSMNKYGKTVKPSTYERQIKSANTLKRAKDYLATGKLPGKDNSIRAQRERKAATQRLDAKRVARRGDTASVNRPMSGTRGRQLNSEITRNVAVQKASRRAESKAMNKQFKADQSKAKSLREKYGDQLAKDFAAKSGQKVSAVKSAIKTMPASKQVTLLTKAGREQRAKANFVRTSDTRNKPGSTMIRRPTQKMTRSNLRAEKAMEFYKDPKKALKSVNKKRAGFKMPRGMR